MTKDMALPAGRAVVNGAASVSAVPASVPSADMLVRLIVDWGNIPAKAFHDRYPFFEGMRERAYEEWGIERGHADSNWAATLGVICELAEEIDAQASAATPTEPTPQPSA